jgi:hypothetical protein
MMHFFLVTNTMDPPLLGDEGASSHVTIAFGDEHTTKPMLFLASS